ncbi:MAG: Cleavage polyadenylation factor subunit clp1, partial [Watsoniomyces obsoletus]
MGRMAQDADVREAGIIIDTPGSLTNSKPGSSVGYEIISHIVSELSVNCIVCLGSERLYSDMVKRFDRQPVAAPRTSSAPT